jgi:hypothetical protein
MKARLGAFAYDDQRARGGGHDPVIVARVLAAGLGALPTGLLLAQGDAGAVPYEEVTAEALGVGTGAVKAFAADLAKAPVHRGSVLVTDGVETFADDGCGRLVGSAGGTGVVNYATGETSVGFAANVANGVSVTAAYARKFCGVLDESADTAVAGSGLVIIHGSVRADVLKIGLAAPVAPSAATLARMQDAGVYPA